MAYLQQGSRLTGGTTPTEAPGIGWAVALSADGDVLVAGAVGNDDANGEVLIFTRTGVAWELAQVLPNAAEDGVSAKFGWAVAVSADGDTILAAAPEGQFPKGSAFVFVRDGESWGLEQELLPTDMIQNGPGFNDIFYGGGGVSLSSDGNTAVIGGPRDNSHIGAAWVWTRSGGSWTQQAKLIGSTSTGYIDAVNSGTLGGYGVSISGDGLTVAFGGSGGGTAPDPPYGWVFVFVENDWVEQQAFASGVSVYGSALSENGDTLLFSDATNDQVTVWERTVGSWDQVATLTPSDLAAAIFPQNHGGNPPFSLTADGRTAVIGCPDDTDSLGAFWVFSDDGGGWEQQGDKYIPLDWTGSPVWFGMSVAITADGRYIASGGPLDDTFDVFTAVGAAWIFFTDVGTSIEAWGSIAQ